MSSDRSLTEKRIETIIGNLLRIGVMLAATVILIGGILYLSRFGSNQTELTIFRSEPENLRTVPGIVERSLTWSSRGLIQLGLLVLIATPVARVVFALVAFAIKKDFKYVAITFVVLAVLVFSLLGGRL